VRAGIEGHEAVGQVMAVGKSVTRVHVGDHVAVYNLIGCGRCPWCLQGRITWCQDTQGSVNGGLGGVLVAPQRNLLPLPPDLDWVPIEEIARGFDLFIDRKDGCIKVVVMVCPR